ncbi:MAG: flippase-like domain-containing protein [Deferribacterales bacterium]|nr:flippase-like domain-containing protein [Deferribacterales bacterium]
MNNKVKTAVKIVVSLGLLALLLKISGPEKVFTTISGSNPTLFALASLLIFIGTVVAAYRWYTVMAALDFKGNFIFYIKSYFMGVFFNQLLPSSIGGDAYRVIDVSRLGYRKRDAFVGVLIDRGLGILGIFIVNIIFNNMLPGLLPEAIYQTLNAISLVGILGFTAFVFIHKISSLNNLKFFAIVVKPSSELCKVINTPFKLVFQLCLTTAVHMLTFAGVYFIALSIGVNLSVSTFMVIMPPVILLTIIPISLAGWGIREGAMAGLLSFAGVSKELAISISILYGFTYILQGIIGLILWIKSKGDKVKTHES